MKYHEEYRNNNRDIIHQQQNEKYKQNPEKYKLKSKLIYEKNKEKLLEKQQCECGSEYVAMGKLRHLRTKKHLQWLNSQQTQENLS